MQVAMVPLFATVKLDRPDPHGTAGRVRRRSSARYVREQHDASEGTEANSALGHAMSGRVGHRPGGPSEEFPDIELSCGGTNLSPQLIMGKKLIFLTPCFVMT